MEKYILTIEFRYNKAPKHEGASEYGNDTITIGIYDTFDIAATEGNKQMKIFEEYFKLNPNWNTKERFSKNGGVFGSKKDLITNTAYLQTSFSFFAKIETLKFNDLKTTIENVIKQTKEYREYKEREQEEDN